jgi:hypothetical protein
MAWQFWLSREAKQTDTIRSMKLFFALLMVANLMAYGLGAGWFGHTRAESGRSPAMMSSQLNVEALTVSQGRLQAR